MIVIKKILKKLKELWTIYGGITLSTLIAWWCKFKKYTMDLWSSYFTLTITCIGLLTFFKLLFTQRKKNKLDIVAVSQNKSIHQIQNALYPEKQGKELGEAIVYTIKGGKRIMNKVGRFFKWLWGNKFTLISIISNLCVSAVAQFIMYSDKLKDFAFFQTHKIWFIIVVTALCVLWLADNIFCVVTKYGLENLDELKIRSEEKKKEQVGKLSAEQKGTLRNVLKGLKEKKNEITALIAENVKNIAKFEHAIQDFNLVSRIVTPSADAIKEYNENVEKLELLKNESTKLENEKLAIAENIKKIKDQL